MAAHPVAPDSLLESSLTFQSAGDDGVSPFDLDPRLLKAVGKMGFVNPTLVQARCIPLGLAGKDMLVRARTGSGKTAAFALPLLHKILRSKESSQRNGDQEDMENSVKAVILVPTRELCEQIKNHVSSLMLYCRDLVSILALSSTNLAAQAAQLRDSPDIVVATPARLLSHVESGNVQLKNSVESLVIDEADLVLSYGYDEDITKLVGHLPKICQTYLMSATLSPELMKLKNVILSSPAIVKLEQNEAVGDLKQYYISVPTKDRQLLLIALVKLGLVHDKVLFFVNSVDSCYRLKLFLEQFSIKSAVLNAELPVASRQHIIEEYNKGLFDFLIATDESMEDADDMGMTSSDEEDLFDELSDDEEANENVDNRNSSMDEDDDKGSDDEDEDYGDRNTEKEQKIKNNSVGNVAKGSSKKKSQADSHYGVSRGVDFKGVKFVVNVDFPTSVTSYTHRIGRTARGGASGTALSLVCEDDQKQLELLAAVQRSQVPLQPEDAGLDGLQKYDDNKEDFLQPSRLALDMKEIEGFRYRVEDVTRAVTGTAVKDARLKEIKQEMLNSERLREHFERNPADMQILRHDKSVTHANRVQKHLADIPAYLIPKQGGGQKPIPVVNIKKRKRGKATIDPNRPRSNDPLQSFEFGGGDDLRAAATEDLSKRVYRGDELGTGTSNRQKWKQRHKKGRFNPKTQAKIQKKKMKAFTY